jgi:N-acetylneuraminic acid mutarotase
MHAQTMQSRSRWLAIAALSFGACISGCGGGGGGAEGSTAAPPAPSPLAPPSAPPPPPIHIDGAVQKGPFLVGSTILINRRDLRGFSTASTILSEIEDSIGSFDFVTTDPGLVQIVATGYYFSELTGQVSNGTLTLRALYKITDQPGQKAYVNIMTHLINDRVLALLAAGNIDTASAIAKAETELVKAFRDALPVASVEGFSGLSVYNMSGAAGAGVGNTYLLALSTGFYKYAATKAEEFGTATDAELTLVLNKISDDLAADGDLDTPIFIREFTTAIRRLSPETIADNLRRRAIVDYPAGLDVPDISVFLNLCAGNFACPWSGAAPLPKPTDSHSTAAYGGKVYLFGGDNTPATGFRCDVYSFGFPKELHRDVFVYDPAANSWQSRGLMPVAMCLLDAHTVGDKIYLIPKRAATDVDGTRQMSMSNAIYEYDPAADRWTQKTPRPTYRNRFVTATVGGKVYVLGGQGTLDNGPKTEDEATWPEELKAHVEIYDPATDSWSFGRPAPFPFAGSASCAVRNQIYVFGILTGDWTWEPSVLVYDTEMDQWSAKAPLSARLSDRTCVTVGERVWLFGGETVSPPTTASDRVDLYDPLSDYWVSNTRLPTARSRLSATRIGNEVFIFGGKNRFNYNDAAGLDVLEVLNLDVIADDAVP